MVCRPWVCTWYLNLTNKFEVSILTPLTTTIWKAIQNVEIGWFGVVSPKITLNSTNPNSTYEFLLAFHSNYMHGFWVIARYWSKIAASNLPHFYLMPMGCTFWNFAEIFGSKTSPWAIVWRNLRDARFSRLGRTPTCVWWRWMHIPRLLSCSKITN